MTLLFLILAAIAGVLIAALFIFLNMVGGAASQKTTEEECERIRRRKKNGTLYGLLLLLSVTAPLRLPAEVPPFQSVTFEFVPASPTNQVLLYRIYTVTLPNFPGTTNLYGTTTSNRFTITNMLAAPQRVYVASSNVWGEGDLSAPYEMPTRPAPPSSLRPITTSLVVPLPGTIEGTTDLTNWNTRLGLSLPANNTLTFTHTLRPAEPLTFWRAKVLTAVNPPPLPQ